MTSLRIAAIQVVAVNFLYPFQVDDRHHADFQIAVLGDIDLISDHGAVQPFIEQQLGVLRNVLPFGEGAGRRAVSWRLRHRHGRNDVSCRCRFR